MDFKVSKLEKLKKKFCKDINNRIIQNALCSNHLLKISEDRNYMQSRDCYFSHVLDPELIVSNQGQSGSCWAFAFFNIVRHELIRKYQLSHSFQLSEGYLTFYEKLEKCNFFLVKFLKKNKIDSDNLETQNILLSGADDGGLWITCMNIVRKYGIIPSNCFRESINSYSTGSMNEILNYKLREFAIRLTSETNYSKKIDMKDKMMEEIYDILCKMLGSPPNPNEIFNWSYELRMDLNEQLERENKRQKMDGKFENLQIKKTVQITPLKFFNEFIIDNLNDYLRISNDPRNEYNKYYESYEDNIVVGGEKSGYYNLDMKEIVKICINSIINNSPIECDIDVGKYINPIEELLDEKCYNYDLIFGSSFDSLSKKQLMNCLESYPTHAVIIVGVDLDKNGIPLKWKIENSWGIDPYEDKSTGHYTMSHSWFEKYVFNIVVNKKYASWRLNKNYNESIKNPVILPKNDIMG
jgi:bleomycin hydrolase